MHIHPGGSWSGSGSSDEDLATVSRLLGVTAATLSGWRDAFLDGGEANLATRPVDGEERKSDRLKRALARCCSRPSFFAPARSVAGRRHPVSRVFSRQQAKIVSHSLSRVRPSRVGWQRRHRPDP